MISVIIPAKNEEEDIENCLKSLKNQDCEIIVAIDNSTDRTEEIARKYTDRVIVSNDPNANNAKARNKGVRLSKGEYIVFLDADMTPPEDFIGKIKNHIPFKIMFYRDSPYPVKTFMQKCWKAYRISKNYLELNYIFSKKTFLNDFNGFNEKFVYYGFEGDMNERIEESGIGRIDSGIIVKHRDHTTVAEYLHSWGVTRAKSIFQIATHRLNILKWFVPCLIFPIWIPFNTISLWRKNKMLFHSFMWTCIELIARFMGLTQIKYVFRPAY